MKRFLASALVLSSFSLFAVVGCSEETKQKDVSTISGPEGTVKKTTETKVEATGDMKPAATGEAPK